MNERKEPRFEVDQPVIVTNLDDPEVRFAGRLSNFSAKGVQLILSRSIPSGTALKVEWGQTLLLGEVIYCVQQGDMYHAGLDLEDALYDTGALIAQMGSLSHLEQSND